MPVTQSVALTTACHSSCGKTSRSREDFPATEDGWTRISLRSRASVVVSTKKIRVGIRWAKRHANCTVLNGSVGDADCRKLGPERIASPVELALTDRIGTGDSAANCLLMTRSRMNARRKKVVDAFVVDEQSTPDKPAVASIVNPDSRTPEAMPGAFSVGRENIPKRT